MDALMLMLALCYDSMARVDAAMYLWALSETAYRLSDGA